MEDKKPVSYTCLNYKVENNICEITLNRPEVFNAFNDDMSYEMQDALKNAARDKNARVVVISGNGKAFCSGQDLKAISGGGKRSLSESLYKRYNPIILAIRNMPKPIIAKVNGVAAGAGCSLALACDYIVAADHVSFIQIFVNVGLVPDSGSSYFLPKSIGYARAFEMATQAPKIKAEQALAWGMINKVCTLDELENECKTVAEFYAKSPTKSIGMIKKMLNKAMNNDLEYMLQYEAYCQEIAGRSMDYNEGVTAFNEKRKPEFKGE